MEDATTKASVQNSLFATEFVKISRSSLLIDDCKYASPPAILNSTRCRYEVEEKRASRKRNKQGRFSERVQRRAQVQSSRIERFGELKRAYLGQSVVHAHLFARKANCHATVCIERKVNYILLQPIVLSFRKIKFSKFRAKKQIQKDTWKFFFFFFSKREVFLPIFTHACEGSDMKVYPREEGENGARDGHNDTVGARFVCAKV